MAYNLKDAVEKESRFTSGHRMCAGCGAPPVIRNVLVLNKGGIVA